MQKILLLFITCLVHQFVRAQVIKITDENISVNDNLLIKFPVYTNSTNLVFFSSVLGADYKLMKLKQSSCIIAYRKQGIVLESFGSCRKQCSNEIDIASIIFSFNDSFMLADLLYSSFFSLKESFHGEIVLDDYVLNSKTTLSEILENENFQSKRDTSWVFALSNNWQSVYLNYPNFTVGMRFSYNRLFFLAVYLNPKNSIMPDIENP